MLTKWSAARVIELPEAMFTNKRSLVSWRMSAALQKSPTLIGKCPISRDDQNIDKAQFPWAGYWLVSNANKVVYVKDKKIQ